jgi:integrase
MTGNITRRGTHTWCLKFERGERDPLTGKRQTRYVTVRGTKKDAQRELIRLLAEVEDGTAVDPTQMTVAEYLGEWLTSIGHLANKTHERYRGLTEQQIVPHVGKVVLQRFRPAHIAEWHATLLRSGGAKGRPLFARTVGHARGVLHAALARAMRLEIVGRNVASALRPPTVETEEVMILTGEQVSDVLAKLEAIDFCRFSLLRWEPVFDAANCALFGGGMLTLLLDYSALRLRWNRHEPGCG